MRRLCLAVLLTALVPTVAVAPTRADPAQQPVSHRFLWANAWQALGDGAPTAIARMDRMTALIRRLQPAAGTLAELMPSQLQRFDHDMRGRYRLVAGSRQSLTNAVLYDPTVYRLVSVQRFSSYFFFGQHVRQPVAVLEDRQSGARVAVIAVHNPANLYGRDNGRWRAKAIAAELAEVARLRRAGLPVLLGGDFNNTIGVRRELVTRGALSSAVPDGPGLARRVGIDQLFAAGVTLSGYRPLTGPRIDAITNHRVIYTADYQVEWRPSPQA